MDTMTTRAARGTGRRWLAQALTVAVLSTGLLAVAPPVRAANLPWGPYTCANGYVWREAVPGDQVCVTPRTRTDTQTENALGPSRREPDGFCKVGFVWRETRPSDHVCVVPSSRDRASSDNVNAPRRLVDPAATPRGGVAAFTVSVPYQHGANLGAHGTGLSPHRPVSFYAVGLHGVAGPGWLGWLTADSSGTASGFVTELFCRPGQTRRVVIVAVDEGSGLVTNAGDTDAFRRCGVW